MKLELLNKITPQKIGDIIHDMEAMLEGYTIINVIDTYDIIEYCFPLGIESEEKSNKSIDQIGEEQIAYEFLFNRFDKGKALMFEEYKMEILYFRNKILRVKDSIERQKSDIREMHITPIVEESNRENRKMMLTELENTLSFLLSFALMPDESVTRFSSIINNKFILDFDELSDPVLRDIVIQSEEEAARVEKKVFEEWVKEYKESLKGITHRTELIHKMNTAFRDVRVILRVLFINKHLLAQGSPKKYIVLLHSSTPERSESIMRQESIQRILPRRDNEPYRILRDKSQTFLLSLLWKEQDDRKKMLEDIVEQLSQYKNSMTEWVKISGTTLNNPLYVNSSNVLGNALDRFENSSLMARINDYMKYKQSVRKQISEFKRDNDNLEPVVKIYERILSEAREQMKKVGPELLFENVKLAYSLQVSISTIYARLKESKKMIVSKGKDLIRGSFHHLPFLLFLSEKNIDVNAKKVLDPLLQFCFKPEQARNLDRDDFLFILDRYQEFDAKFVNETPSITLVSLFLILLLPVSDEKGVQSKNNPHENDVLHHANDLVPIYENLNEIHGTGSIDYYRELLYINIWLYRRCLKFEDSLALAREGIKKYPNDPRFYHGLGLSLYSKYLGSNTKREFQSIAQIEEVTGAIIKARELYDKLDEIHKNYKTGLTLVALHNMLSHLNAEVYKFKSEEAPLLLARENLNQVKLYLKEEGAFSFSEYPEFLHTEANLELQEAKHYESLTDHQKAHDKLLFASEAISNALKMVPDSELYKNTSEAIAKYRKTVNKVLVKKAKQSAKPDQ